MQNSVAGSVPIMLFFCVLFAKMGGRFSVFDGLNVKFEVLYIVFLNLSAGLPK